MTNNRKPVDEVRLSLSAARRREAGTHLYERLADKDMRDKPYTPPPAVAAWLQAQADKPKGRDYDAILRAAKKAPVGYWEDAPTGIKFGASSARSPEASEVGGLTKTPTHAPTPPQSADGPWPKWEMFIASGGPHKGQEYVRRSDGPSSGQSFFQRGVSCTWNTIAPSCGTLTRTQAEIAQWLEQNGHKDVAAQLRGTPRAEVATGGGRVWKDKYNGWRGVWLNGRSFGKSATCASFEDITASRDLSKDASGYEVELFGPERDAILSECRKAMGVNVG